MKFANIPQEMRTFRQWILWKFEDNGGAKPDKVPVCPHTRSYASVSDQNTWAGFDDVLAIFEKHPGLYAGIGFVLTKSDPFVFIDLDDTNGNIENQKRQEQIYSLANSYSERSPSGKGLHIIGLGSIPSGRRRSNIEIYSEARFMTMTGDVYNYSPIKDCQELVQELWAKMGGDKGRSFYDPMTPETEDDDTICNKASLAENGQKFLDLYNGNWQVHYPPPAQSQSEADQAFINILAFYTQNRTQIKRIFHKSALGQRDKAKRKDYLKWTINRAFDRCLPPVDITGLQEAVDKHLLAMREKDAGAESGKLLNATVSSSTASSSGEEGQAGDTAPARPRGRPKGSRNQVPQRPLFMQQRAPGLLGALADFVYDQATLPVPEVAVASALGFMAAVSQRAFNVSGTGLNQYILLLARTGIGKESMASGIDKIVNRVREYVPGVLDYFGPSSIASGQAVERHLSEQPAFLSIVGEVDKMILQLSSKNANFAQIELRKKILDLYNKSGYGRTARGTIYSDKDKNTKDVTSPAFSILGEGTPERLYAILDEDMILEGLLSRFTIIEYKGERVKRNKEAHTVQPSQQLIDGLCALVDICVKMDSSHDVMTVQFTDEAAAMLDIFEEYCRVQVNNRHYNQQAHLFADLWARAHLKTCKLAALVAVGVNPHNPMIDIMCAEWAKSLVLHDVESLIERFERGETGTQNDEMKQAHDMRAVLKQYVEGPYDKIAVYGCLPLHYQNKVIPHTWIMRRLAAQSAFKHDKMGATFSIKRTLKNLVDEGTLIEINKQQSAETYKNGVQCYAIGNLQFIMNP